MPRCGTVAHSQIELVTNVVVIAVLGVPMLVRRGSSVLQDDNAGVKGRRAVYDVVTQHGEVVIINSELLMEGGQSSLLRS